MWHTAVWKVRLHEYDSDGRRRQVPVAQSYNLRYSKRPLSGSIFRKTRGLRIAHLSGSQQVLEYGGYQYGINWDTPVDGRHKLFACHGRGASRWDLRRRRILAFNMSFRLAF